MMANEPQPKGGIAPAAGSVSGSDDQELPQTVVDLVYAVETGRASGKSKVYGPNSLVVRIRAKGKATFWVRSRNPKKKWEAIGELPQMSIEEALVEAKRRDERQFVNGANGYFSGGGLPRSPVRKMGEDASYRPRVRRIQKLPFKSIIAVGRFVSRLFDLFVPNDVRIAVLAKILVPVADDSLFFAKCSDIECIDGGYFLRCKIRQPKGKLTNTTGLLYLPKILVGMLDDMNRSVDSQYLFPRFVKMGVSEVHDEIGALIDAKSNVGELPANAFLETFRYLSKRNSVLLAKSIDAVANYDRQDKIFRDAYLPLHIGLMEWWAREIIVACERVRQNSSNAHSNLIPL